MERVQRASPDLHVAHLLRACQTAQLYIPSLDPQVVGLALVLLKSNHRLSDIYHINFHDFYVCTRGQGKSYAPVSSMTVLFQFLDVDGEA